MISNPAEHSKASLNLMRLLRETKKYHRNKETLFKYYVKERLEKSYEAYEKSIENPFQALSHRKSLKSNVNILKRL